jgi:hypothetical protein
MRIGASGLSDHVPIVLDLEWKPLQAYAQRRLFPPAAWDRGLSRLASQADATAA